MKPEFFEDTEVYQKHFTEEEVPYPTVALLETTSLCNLECPMCQSNASMDRFTPLVVRYSIRPSLASNCSRVPAKLTTQDVGG